jgi:hypothetical protein
MLKRVIVMIAAIGMTGASLSAQRPAAKPQPTTKPAQEAKAAAPKPATPGQPSGLPVNIRIDVAITDQVDPGAPAKKVVSMIVADRQRNNIRSSGNIRTNGFPQNFTLNVDAHPTIMPNAGNRISLEFGLEYLPKSGTPPASDTSNPGTSLLNERLVVLLESGKPVLVSQAADPISDRKITVEVTATILK